MENLRKERAPKAAKESATKTPLNSRCPAESWKQLSTTHNLRVNAYYLEFKTVFLNTERRTLTGISSEN